MGEGETSVRPGEKAVICRPGLWQWPPSLHPLFGRGRKKNEKNGMEQDDDGGDASVFVITLHLIP